MKLNINQVGECESLLPMYDEYSAGQESIAYLYLDTRDGDVWVGSKAPHDNSIGQDQFNGHVRAWRIPNNLTVSGYNKLMSDEEIQGKLLEVCAGSELKYNGNNYRTYLTEEAQDASFYLEQIFEDIYFYKTLEHYEVASAQHYLDHCSYASLVNEGESHEQAAERICKEALSNRYYLSEYEVEQALDTMKSWEEE